MSERTESSGRAEAMRRIVEARESRGSLLNLNGLELSEAPAELFELEWIEFLALARTGLKSISPKIARLRNLRLLYLIENQLTSIPAEIGLLTRLEELALEGNGLTKLPETLGKLPKLAWLDVSDNRLTALPASLARCSALTKLLARNNQLTDLPRGLAQLQLRTLALEGNAGLGLPDAVLKTAASPRDILDAFYASRTADARPLNEIKLVLVGRGAAGKTSIARRLIKETFSPSQRETHGIDITRWLLRCGEHDVRVHVWDFAGQVVTHSTHQFFLSESSVYILVLTGREDTQKSDAEYWLRLIRAFAGDERGEVSPVIVALNKFDAHPFSIDRRALQEKYPFIAGFVETDCKSGRGIDALKGMLSETIARTPIVTQQFKRQWWEIKEELERKQRRQNYVPYAAFQQIAAKHGEPEPDRQRFLADVFHALGVALNYGRDERLRDSTVLNPRWVTDGIYRLLREGVADDGSAVLTMDAVRRVLAGEPETMQRYLVDLMRRFDLAVPLGEGEDRWLVPQRLAGEQPELAADWPTPAPADATRLRYRYAVIPEGLLPRFIARTYPLSEAGDGDARHALPRWRGGVVLAKEDARALARVDVEERRIDVTVTGSPEARLELLGVIRADFATIHADIKGLEFVAELEVAGHPGVFVPEATLRADERNETQSSAATSSGSVPLDPTTELNRLSEPAARDPKRWRPRVFISYTSADWRQRDQLLTELKPLKATHGLLDEWVDGYIPPGADWDAVVREELERADVVLLLVSREFIASDYVRGVEVKRAVARASAGECIVIPIILDRADWAGEPFGHLNALPRKGKPIRDASPQRNAWAAVGRELRGEFGRLVADRERARRRATRKPGRDVDMRGVARDRERDFDRDAGREIRGHMAF